MKICYDCLLRIRKSGVVAIALVVNHVGTSVTTRSAAVNQVLAPEAGDGGMFAGRPLHEFDAYGALHKTTVTFLHVFVGVIDQYATVHVADLHLRYQPRPPHNILPLHRRRSAPRCRTTIRDFCSKEARAKFPSQVSRPHSVARGKVV